MKFWIIPALAGNTFRVPGSAFSYEDHPRSRGEYFPELPIEYDDDGSSPLSRGIRWAVSPATETDGIIPALAGNTHEPGHGRPAPTDHPRSRGEYGMGGHRTRPREGSSPLSRGIPMRVNDSKHHVRIIPALAGNTYKGGNPNEDAGDHPRSRGEYVQSLVPSSAVPGSSPLSRGIPPPLPLTIAMVRIIPALAGNTCSTCANPRASWDHPRSRGEYDDLLCQRETCEGSSPLSRGIPRTNSSRCTCPRIIPALAGNTRSPGCIRICSRDHPRSRGEYMLPWWKPCWTRGSSPLSRGILCFAGNGCSRGGIIPALAGNTQGWGRVGVS